MARKPTVDTESVAQDQIRAFVGRVERLNEELDAINDDKKEIFAEAKANGFNVPVLKQCIKLRSQDIAETMERDALVELYMAALGRSPVHDMELIPSSEEDEDDEPPAPAPARESASSVPTIYENVGEPVALPVANGPSDDPASIPGQEGLPEPAHPAAGSSGETPEQTGTVPVAVPVTHTNVTPFVPKPHDGPTNSKGLKRHKHCLNFEACAGKWNALCHGCETALAVEAGGTEIEHQGSVA